MTSYENEHEVGHYFAQSGSFRWLPQVPSLVPPGYGAMVTHQLGARPGMPAFVQIGEMLSSAANAGMGGILGRSMDPMVLGGGRTAQSKKGEIVYSSFETKDLLAGQATSNP
jgi:hypothetical protein